MDKRTLSEQDIRSKFITPAILKAGWNLQTQIREEVTFTAGRVIVRGEIVSRGKAKRADYILYFKPNVPVAIIEAKDNKHSIGDGMQQALDYGRSMDVPFVYSTNGDAFLEHDRSVKSGQIERELPLDSFPTPGELWKRYCEYKGIDPKDQPAVVQDFYTDTTGKTPRYYQLVAINRTVEAISNDQDRILLVMATGTGKTYTAFQIIWRLWKSRMKKRILFLADRNILVDQARMNDFKPFGSAMTKIKNRQVDKSYEVYLALYQSVTGTEEEKNIYKQFSKDFFDLIVVDECHRGSAAEDSAWREVLDYFESATQIGMTATPKETKYVSNIEYFGDPIFIYSLRQGIEDGFLAPYKVIRIDIDRDLVGWRPSAGERDKYGKYIEDRVYNQKDFDKCLVLEKRTELVAKKITEFLKLTNRFDKSIVFCEDINHAERMRKNLVNENSDLVSKNDKYIMRITGDESLGKAELDNFIDPESRYPVIVTTSKLLSTGVDAQTCKLIVLDQNIQSLSAFKQIIGRGTRIQEEYGKLYFTIMDFRKATTIFADPGFDGDPVKIYEPKPGDPPKPPDEPGDPPDPPREPTGRIKYFVDNVEVNIVAERVQYYATDGKLITESLRDYTRKNVLKEFASLDSFLNTWSRTEKKHVILEELKEQGIFLDALKEEVGHDYDPFDLICHIAFDQPPLTRQERANNVRKRNYFSRYGENAQAVLNALLDKYATAGIRQIEDINILKVPPIEEYGTPIEIIGYFGGRDEYLSALRELEKYIYSAA